MAWTEKDVRREIYVLQEGAPCDDISLCEPRDRRNRDQLVGDDELTFPIVIASADRGAVRPWCESKGIALKPQEFAEGQVDYIIELDTRSKREAFRRKWLPRE